MSSEYKKCVIRIVGVALEGRQGTPVLVFESPLSGEFLTVSVDPFDAEMIIRDFIGDAEHSAAAWLEDLLKSSPPLRGVLDAGEEGQPRVLLEFGFLGLGFRRNRILPLGEGLALLRRLSVPLYAGKYLFDTSREELGFLSESKAFGGEFLYLTPPQYAPNIPMA